MKRALLLFVLAAASLGCMTIQQRIDRARYGENPYAKAPFYSRYLNPADARDRQIQQLLEVLRTNPRSAAAHNELGSLLVAKRFPKDAEREFRRAVSADPDFYPAWYNLALVQTGRGDTTGAVRSLRRALELKPGHAAAHFQLGLIHEKRGQSERAIEHYAKAFTINQALLDIRNNPRLVDTRLLDRTLLKMYPTAHASRSIRFQATPADYVQPEAMPEPQQAPSEQASPGEIVTPAPPVTEPSQQTPPPPPTQSLVLSAEC